jgi:hypothetical protein
MNPSIIPLMIALTALLIVGLAYVVYTFWRFKHVVASNVVNAALVVQTASPELRREIDTAIEAILPAHRLNPESFARLSPEVRFALYSIALRRMGIRPPGSDKPFYPLSSPQLARSAGTQILFVRTQVESEHKVKLTELDPPAR